MNAIDPAQKQAEIASTTTSLYEFILKSVDEFREAKKRIVYESTVALSDEC